MIKKLSYTNRFAYLRGKIDWEEQEHTIVKIFIVEGLLSKKPNNPQTKNKKPGKPGVAARSKRSLFKYKVEFKVHVGLTK